MEHPQWFRNDRNPAITDTVTIAGVPVDLSTKDTTFKMRAFNSTTLKVNSAVSTKTTAGVWTYNWGATDLDTAGEYLVWVTVDMGGGTLQTVNEDTIVVAEHGPGTNAYLELEELKSTLEIDERTLDQDIRAGIIAASRVVDELTGTRFYTTTGTEIRYYTPTWNTGIVPIHDLNALTEVATDDAGDFNYTTVWTENSDFVLEPLNATVDGTPWNTIRMAANADVRFRGYPRSVRVTGKFGWATPPEPVKVATGIIATQLLTQARSAPLGVITAFDGTVARASRFGPRVDELLAPYKRPVMFA